MIALYMCKQDFKYDYMGAKDGMRRGVTGD